MNTRARVFNWLLVFLTLTSVGFAFWGWYSLSEKLNLTLGDSLYLSFTTLILSSAYELSNQWNFDWRIDLARWLGVAAFILAASKAITYLLANRLKHWKAGRRCDHTILIGDDAFAEAIAFAIIKSRQSVNWISAPDGFESTEANLFVTQQVWRLSLAQKFGLRKAKNVVIATKSDAKAITIARQIRKEHPDENSLQVFVTIQSPWIAQSVDELDGVKGIRMFSRPQAAARVVHRKHPPFLIARISKQTRIHALIIGFDGHGEAILIDLLLYCLTTFLEKPLITIIDVKAEQLRSQLLLRYPEIEKTAELNFVSGSLQGSESNMSETSLVKIASQHEITTAYICLGNDDNSLSTGLALRAIALRNSILSGPIFIRLTGEDTLRNTEAGVSHLERGQLIAYGSLNTMVGETGVMDSSADALPHILHEAYRGAADGSVSDVPWEDLPEDKKDSNRRLIPHIFAKLASNEFNIEPWIKELDGKSTIKNLPHVPDFISSNEKIEQLARLEHDRWMADRRVNGWQHSAERNDERKQHPDLVPFESLSEASKEYDRGVVRALSELLISNSSVDLPSKKVD